MRKFELACITILTGFFISCQTVSPRHFPEVRVGMDKSSVLDLIGGPQKASRVMGRDRWIYIFRTPTEGEQAREIHFEYGKVVYVGGRVAPPVPAEDQDHLNEKLLREDQIASEAQRVRWDQEHGALRGDGSPLKTADEDDLRLRDSIYGTDFYKKSKREQNKVAPKFEPVD